MQALEKHIRKIYRQGYRSMVQLDEDHFLYGKNLAECSRAQFRDYPEVTKVLYAGSISNYLRTRFFNNTL